MRYPALTGYRMDIRYIPNFRKEFLDDTYFFYSVRAFAPIPQHYFSKYWGANAWAVPPPQIFLGDRPHYESPPLIVICCVNILPFHVIFFNNFEISIPKRNNM